MNAILINFLVSFFAAMLFAGAGAGWAIVEGLKGPDRYRASASILAGKQAKALDSAELNRHHAEAVAAVKGTHDAEILLVPVKGSDVRQVLATAGSPDEAASLANATAALLVNQAQTRYQMIAIAEPPLAPFHPSLGPAMLKGGFLWGLAGFLVALVVTPMVLKRRAT